MNTEDCILGEEDVFDWELYRALNPQARLPANRAACERHFIMYGFPWRVCDKYPDFDEEQYRINYPDELAGCDNLARHWAMIGSHKGLTYYNCNKYNYVNGIDRIYWINLERRPDRRLSMEAILSRLNDDIHIERVVAYDGQNNLREIQGKLRLLNRSSYKMTPGAWGCLLSHLETVRKFYESGAERALILEDDITTESMPFWRNTIEEIIVSAPKDWQIITLKYGNPLEQPKRLYTRWTALHYFTAAYVINREGAERIMQMWKPVPVPVPEPGYKTVTIRGRSVKIASPTSTQVVPVLPTSPIEYAWHISGLRHDADYIIYNSCITYVYAYSLFLSDETTSNIDVSHMKLHNNIKQKALQLWRAKPII